MDYLKAGFTFEQLKRSAPAAKDFGKVRRKKLEEEYIPEYLHFLEKSRVPTEVVKNVVEMAQVAGFVSGINDEKPFFVTNREANAFAIAHPGRGSNRLNRGLRLIFTHVDSPCLKLKSSPTLLEGSYDDTVLTSGVLLDAENYGSIDPTQWIGRNLRLIGEFFIGGRRRKIELPCFSAIYSLHLKEEKIKITEDNLKIETGFQSVKELYDFFGIERESDFSRLRAHLLPDEKPRRIGTGDFITGYGHDDRVCVYSAAKALIESKPTSPSFVFGFDKEEIGSSGPNTAYFGFFRKIITDTIARFSNSVYGSTSLENLIERGLLKGVPAICADVEAASSYFEAENEQVDGANIAKFLHGPYLYAHESPEGNIVTARNLDYFISLYNETMGKNEKIALQRFQVIGNPLNPSHGEAGATIADIFAKQNIPLVIVGPPVEGLHNPVEMVNAIDFYWIIQAYKAYFQERPSFRGGGKRKIG